MRGILVTLILVLAAAAVCALGFNQFVRPRLPPPENKRALVQLSTMMDTHIDLIFSPLNGELAPVRQHELRQLREQFADSLRTAEPSDRRTYAYAIELCDALLGSLQTREREAASLAATRSRPYGVGISQDQKTDSIAKERFFEAAITRRWAESAKEQRIKVMSLYAKLREGERKRNTAEATPR